MFNVDISLERVDKRLSSWKGKKFSLGGRIALIKSAMCHAGAIRFILSSFFKCPKSVVRWIEKIPRDFLWNDHVDKRKYHLVSWALVCKPIEQGGMGI